MYAGSNTQKGSAYHSFDGFEGNGQAGNVKQRVNLILKNGNINGLNGIDLGCNIGGITLSISMAGAKMTGVDYDQQSIDVARAYAEKFKQKIIYRCEDIDLNTIKSINAGFVVWFSHWMWFCKKHGFEIGLEALFELGRKKLTLYFETSLGDGMAGNVMTANGINESKMTTILKNCFTKVSKIGVDENWRKRPIWKCTGNMPREII